RGGRQRLGRRSRGVMRAVRSYLSDRFPLVSQGGTVLSAYVCCYLLFGQIDGDQAIGWATAVGAVTVVLLALIRRIVDDVEDLGEAPEGRAAPGLRGLLLGAAAATALVGAANAAYGLDLLLLSAGVAAWFPLMTVIKHRAPRSRLLAFVLTESCPAAILAYSYAVWSEASGSRLPVVAVVAVLGLFWTIYQFWGFTRKLGAGSPPPWGLGFDAARRVLIVLLAATAALSAAVAVAAHLPRGYLVYGLALPLAFGLLVQRWWRTLPAPGSSRAAAWAGLPFPAGVEAGILLAVLAESLPWEPV
ncbi:MAG TPA: hypothetical protein VD741_05455, partial [Solirubrobacterales bacterium]|nr:hypothetical protein [Solirubrobacterales bacterium]